MSQRDWEAVLAQIPLTPTITALFANCANMDTDPLDDESTVSLYLAHLTRIQPTEPELERRSERGWSREQWHQSHFLN